MALLACARIGAAHSVVSAASRRDSLARPHQRLPRRRSSSPPTAAGGAAVVPLKEAVDEALDESPTVEHVLVVRPHRHRRRRCKRAATTGATTSSRAPAAECRAERARPPSIRCSSSTPPAPPASRRAFCTRPAGYLLGTPRLRTKPCSTCATTTCTGARPTSAGSRGTPTSSTARLPNGATGVMYEGAPDYPRLDRFWEIIERHNVTIFYTAPTAIRAFMRAGRRTPEATTCPACACSAPSASRSTPRRGCGTTTVIGGDRCPIVDTWWQTETGSILISPLPGVTPTKPGSATCRCRGSPPRSSTSGRHRCRAAPAATSCSTRPWPSMLRTIYGDDERYVETLLVADRRGLYFTGDGAKPRRGRLLLDPRPRRRRAQRRRPPHLAPPRSSRPSSHTRRSPRQPSSAARSPQGPGDRGVRDHHAAASRATACARNCANTWRPRSARSRAPRCSSSRPTCPRRARQDHAALATDIAEGRELGDATTLRDPAIVQAIKASADEQLGRT